MSDEWTGISIEGVTVNLATFEDKANTITSDFRTAFEIVTEDLYQYWASEKAVEFNQNIISVGTVYNDMVNNLYSVLKAAGLAAVEIAMSNGQTFNNPYTEVPQEKLLTEVTTLRSDIDGVQGMNIAAAKASFDGFVDISLNTLSELSGLPTVFGLYDPSGELQRAYEIIISRTRDIILDAVKGSITALNNAFENEVNQIEFGKAEAETILATTMALERNPLGEQIGERYSKDWQQFIDGWNEKWGNLDGVIGVLGSGVRSTLEVIDMAVDGVIDTVLVVPDTITYLLNGLFDVTYGSREFGTGLAYLKSRIKYDFSENWNTLNNATNFWEGALGVLEGTGRTAADALQTAVNAVDVALDWTGDAISDAFNWVGGWFN